MSSRNSPTLTFDVRARRAEQRAAWLTLVATACAVVLLGPVAAVGSGLVAWGLWRAGWIGSRNRIAAVSWLADGRWVLADLQGNTFPGELSAGTRRLRNAVWLSWKTGHGRRRSLFLTSGDVPADHFRWLAARLQIEAPSEVVERALPEAARR
jgi:hypothetical protein